MAEGTSKSGELSGRLAAIAAELTPLATEVEELRQRQEAQERTVHDALAHVAVLASGLRSLVGSVEEDGQAPPEPAAEARSGVRGEAVREHPQTFEYEPERPQAGEQPIPLPASFEQHVQHEQQELHEGELPGFRSQPAVATSDAVGTDEAPTEPNMESVSQTAPETPPPPEFL